MTETNQTVSVNLSRKGNQVNKSTGTIGILSTILGQTHVPSFYNLVRILQSSSRVMVVEVGVEGLEVDPSRRPPETTTIVHRHGQGLIFTILSYLWTQVRIANRIASLAKRVDAWYFFLADNMILPLMAARLSGRRVYLVMGGLYRMDVQHKQNAVDFLMVPLETLGLRLSAGIILYSPRLVSAWNLQRYESKIHIAYQHFLDLDEFNVRAPLESRRTAIGHIGRLSGEKGTINFLHSIPYVLRSRTDVSYVVGGDGPLGDEARILAKKLGSGNVQFLGWVSQVDMPDVLNQLKLLVLPSYTEGLPNIMIEAMACGTPVLATKVGAIPDFIEDGSTGFLMESNSPASIASNILRALEYEHLDEVSMRARALVEEKFTYECALKMWTGVTRESK